MGFPETLLRPISTAWPVPPNGKTVTRRLTETEAEAEDEADRCREWIANDRRRRALISQMRYTAAKATELIMKDSRHGDPEV